MDILCLQRVGQGGGVCSTISNDGEQVDRLGGGGTEPRWRRDGRELYYLAHDGKLMAVTVSAAQVFQSTAPRPLFQTRVSPSTNIFHTSVDASADGQRFLIKTPSENAESPFLTVVVNWHSPQR